jgi:hypothetical protein
MREAFSKLSLEVGRLLAWQHIADVGMPRLTEIADHAQWEADTMTRLSTMDRLPLTDLELDALEVSAKYAEGWLAGRHGARTEQLSEIIAPVAAAGGLGRNGRARGAGITSQH